MVRLVFPEQARSFWLIWLLGDIGRQVIELCGEVDVHGFQLMATERLCLLLIGDFSLLECCEITFG